MVKKFQKDIHRYMDYALYSARADLKSEVASSYLNWLWWILDPLMFMLVYTFIAVIVFDSKVEYFPIFVFVGLSIWNFFNKTVQGSVKMIRNNHAIVSKVYLPKYILVLQKTFVNGFKMLISFALVALMMMVYRVPVTWRIVFMIPILISLFFLTFGIACLVMHFGVFVDDLYNVIQIVLRLMFYMSGIFYSIENRLADPYKTVLLTINPVSMLIEAARNCLVYSRTPNILVLVLWFILSIAVSIVGIFTVYRYENSYVKVA